MSPSITITELESTCGRPFAFVNFVSPALELVAGRGRVESVDLRRWGRLDLELESRTAWWLWPWHHHQPWTVIDAPELERLRRWSSSRRRDGAAELHLVVPRAPERPADWIEQLRGRLQAAGARELQLHLHGPEQLRRWTEGIEELLALEHLRAHRVLEAQLRERTPCERELIAALDEGSATLEHWLVVADELQRRGDPTGESLALALASSPDRPTQSRSLSEVYVEREAMRMAQAPRHLRMLAFVDHRGVSCPIARFCVDAEAEDEQLPVWLWAERVGPFFVRMLVVSADPRCRGLGLPELVFSAPQLRYLSCGRFATIDGDGADISTRDLSGFALGQLGELGHHVFAYEAKLRGCDLRGATLSGWQLDGADLGEAIADLDTRFGQASFDDARVSKQLRRMLDSWNSGRHRRDRGRLRGTASVRRLELDQPTEG